MVSTRACFCAVCDLGDHLELLNAVLLILIFGPEFESESEYGVWFWVFGLDF